MRQTGGRGNQYRRAGAQRPGNRYRRAGAQRPGNRYRRAGAQRPGNEYRRGTWLRRGPRGYARLRSHGRRAHPRRLPDRAHHLGHRQAARPVRPRGGRVLRAVGLPVVARACRRRPWHATHSTDGALPAVPDRAHHARVSGGRRGDPVPVARCQRRHRGVAGQSVADPDLRAVDADRGPDPDVEPVGRGHLLPGIADSGAACPQAAGPGAHPGDHRWLRRPASAGV